MPRGDVKIPFVPPVRGVRADLPRHLVPDGYIASGENILCRDGLIVIRPGMNALVSTAPSTSRVMGGIYFRDHTETNRVVIGTLAGFQSFASGSWSAITGPTTLTGTADNQVRFAPFIVGANTRLLAVNDVDVPQVWTTSGNFADLGGSPPIAKCVAVAFQRAILANITIGGTRRGSSLVPSGFQDTAIWDTTNNIVNLPDTGDSIVEVKALNDQVFAIYKDRSQWVGIGAGGLFPFVFELKDQQIGPVSPGSVVQAEGSHYYVGQDGDIYQFDGTRCRAIGGVIRRLIQSDMDFDNAERCHGFYDVTNREIWWFWPSYRSLDGFGGIVYRIPYDDVPAAFSGLLVFTVFPTASWNWRDTQGLGWDDLTGTWDDLAATYPTWDSFPNLSRPGSLVGLSTGQVARFGRVGGDMGNPFTVTWEYPIRPLAGVGDMVLVDEFETYFKRASSATTCDVSLITSDTLGDEGTVADTTAVDISSTSRLAVNYYSSNLARYVTVRHRMNGLLGLQEWRGGCLYVHRRSEGR